MSEVQEILEALESQLHEHLITEDMCFALKEALDGVPEEYHMKAFKSMLGVEENA